MFMHYCGQKGSKFGELKNSLKQQQKCLEVEKTMLKIKIFLGGHAPKPPYIRAAAKAARGTCLRHVQSDHYWYYIIFRFFLCYSVSCLIARASYIMLHHIVHKNCYNMLALLGYRITLRNKDYCCHQFIYCN